MQNTEQEILTDFFDRVQGMPDEFGSFEFNPRDNPMIRVSNQEYEKVLRDNDIIECFPYSDCIRCHDNRTQAYDYPTTMEQVRALQTNFQFNALEEEFKLFVSI